MKPCTCIQRIGGRTMDGRPCPAHGDPYARARKNEFGVALVELDSIGARIFVKDETKQNANTKPKESND